MDTLKTWLYRLFRHTSVNPYTTPGDTTQYQFTQAREIRDIELIEAERENVSREIHDNLIPLYRVISMSIQDLLHQNEHSFSLPEKTSLVKVHAWLQNIEQGLRAIIVNKSYLKVERIQLKSMIEGLCAQYSQDPVTKIIFRSNATTFEPTITEKKAITYIVQELLTNGMKHSQATTIQVFLTWFPHSLEVRYTDNGVGFSLSKMQSPRSGIGLDSILSRAKLIEAEAEFDAEMQHGVTFTMRLQQSLADAPAHYRLPEEPPAHAVEDHFRDAYIIQRERERIHRDFHDQILPLNTLIQLQLQPFLSAEVSTGYAQEVLSKITQCEQLLRQATDFMRKLMEVTRMKVDLDLPVEEVLSRICQRYSTQALPIQFALHGIRRPIPTKIAQEVPGILQELIMNTLKHSGATKAYMEVTFLPRHLHFLYEDNGVGFPSNPDSQPIQHGMGMLSIQARINELDASSSYYIPEHGKGMGLRLEIPTFE